MWYTCSKMCARIVMVQIFVPQLFERAAAPVLRDDLVLEEALCQRTHSSSALGGGGQLSSLQRGTGGRSSFSGVVCTVFGASGCLGRFLVNKLGKIGTQLVLPARTNLYDMQRLKLCGDLGQVLFMPFHLKDELSIAKAMKYSNVVINLIGKDTETSNFTFNEVHVKGAERIARIARESGVEKLIHFSALNVTENPKPIIKIGGSKFLASKWLGEQLVKEAFPGAIIFRPADMYSHGDHFLSYYVSNLRRNFTYVPVWNKGKGIVKQPVYTENVAEGVVNAIFEQGNEGLIYQAVGLRVQLLETFGFKYPHLSWERLEREHTSDVVYYEHPTLEDLKVSLTCVEDRFPFELKYYREAAYYDPDIAQFEKVRPPPVILD
ncbi:NADH:ubiquinone oxidoreductase subunit 39 isoform X4 [Rhipicephalus microplus]|uniref:NADH:ubiquinone oxidoreductase subunit 39 isoform X4 n=1 Tax=Rhipicephalus microplus TaxID=6941 RepID=UPI003F6BC5A2